MSRFVVVLLVVGLGASAAKAGGTRDLADAWLVSAERAAAVVGQDGADGWSAQLSQGRLFGLPELPQAGVRVGRRGGRIDAALSWERLGRDLYREDTWRGELLFGGRLRLGMRVVLARLELDGDTRRDHREIDLRGRIPLTRRIVLDVWWPLRPAPSWYGRAGLRRWLRIEGGDGGLAWTVAIDRTVSGTPVVGGEVLIGPARQAALGVRYDSWSGGAGLCSAWRIRRLILRTSHLLHPDLGVSHRWCLGLGGAP